MNRPLAIDKGGPYKPSETVCVYEIGGSVGFGRRGTRPARRRARDRRLPAAALAGSAMLVLAAGFATAGTTQANESIVVSTVDDVVNGGTSSPSALVAQPGSDGISLREAILAADDAPAGAHVYVQFADALAGDTIQLTQAEPLRLTHDQLTIEGPATGGQPAVTVVASAALPGLLDLPRRGLKGHDPPPRVLRRRARRCRCRCSSAAGRGAADRLRTRHVSAPPGPSTVSDVDIDENTFANLSGSSAHRIDITNGGATIDRVRIGDNTFTNTNGTDDGDAILAQNWADNSSIDDLTIEGNHFEGISFSVELQPATSGDRWVDSTATGDQIVDTRISRNVFDESWNPIWIGTLAFGDLASGNVMTGTVIDGNVFNMGSRQSGITLTAGAFNASGNSIDDTQILDNLLVGDQPSIFLSGGGENNASDNHVAGVEIANDTLVSTMASSALSTTSTYGSGTGNSVIGLDVRNTIFWGPGWPFNGDITTSNVEFSVTKQPGFAGTNGNSSADPQFVDAAHGDYHLAAASPAIDAGTSVSTRPSISTAGLASAFPTWAPTSSGRHPDRASASTRTSRAAAGSWRAHPPGSTARPSAAPPSTKARRSRSRPPPTTARGSWAGRAHVPAARTAT